MKPKCFICGKQVEGIYNSKLNDKWYCSKKCMDTEDV
jgi:endogenous inhibitor of DNA gyrase (YacG/DUF329 family)